MRTEATYAEYHPADGFEWDELMQASDRADRDELMQASDRTDRDELMKTAIRGLLKKSGFVIIINETERHEKA